MTIADWLPITALVLFSVALLWVWLLYCEDVYRRLVEEQRR